MDTNDKEAEVTVAALECLKAAFEAMNEPSAPRRLGLYSSEATRVALRALFDTMTSLQMFALIRGTGFELRPEQSEALRSLFVPEFGKAGR